MNEFDLYELFTEASVDKQVRRMEKRKIRDAKRQDKKYNKYLRGGGKMSRSDWERPRSVEHEVYTRMGGNDDYKTWLRKTNAEEAKRRKEDAIRRQEQYEKERIGALRSQQIENYVNIANAFLKESYDLYDLFI